MLPTGYQWGWSAARLCPWESWSFGAGKSSVPLVPQFAEEAGRTTSLEGMAAPPSMPSSLPCLGPCYCEQGYCGYLCVFLDGFLSDLFLVGENGISMANADGNRLRRTSAAFPSPGIKSGKSSCTCMLEQDQWNIYRKLLPPLSTGEVALVLM